MAVALVEDLTSIGETWQVQRYLQMGRRRSYGLCLHLGVQVRGDGGFGRKRERNARSDSQRYVGVLKQVISTRACVGAARDDPKLSFARLNMSTNFDRRRINGPEESFSPVFVDDDDDQTKWRPGKPRQSRQPQDIRPICKSFRLQARLVI